MRAQQETRPCRCVEVQMTYEPDSSFCIDGTASDSTCIRACMAHVVPGWPRRRAGTSAGMCAAL